MNKKKRCILELLHAHPAGLYTKQIVELSNGTFWWISGSVYVHLGDLEEEGLIEGQQEISPYTGLPGRFIWRLTKRGSRVPLDDGLWFATHGTP
jgi:DNA-binding PadR family transcriptional regulator